MENFNPLLPENEEKPEKKGESSELKKKRRKTLLVKKPEKVETAPPDQEKKDTKQKPEVSPAPEVDAGQEAEDQEPQVQEAVAEAETDSQFESGEVDSDEEFLGELIIDHSDEEDFHDHLPQEFVDHEDIAPVMAAIEEEPLIDIEQDSVAEIIHEQPAVASAEYVAPEIYSEPSRNELPPSQPLNELAAVIAANEVAQSYEAPVKEKETSPNDHVYDSLAPENPFVGNFGMVNPNSGPKKPERVEPVVSEKESNKRAHRAEKRGLSRGVLTGGIVGWLVGRRGKRAAERQATMAIESRDETIKRLAAERDMQRNLSTSRLGIIERTQGEMRNLLQKSRNERDKLSQRVEDLAEARGKESVNRSPESVAPVFDTLPKPEKPTPKEMETRTAMEVSQDKDQYQAPENHKFELSAWHRIEVDKATGKAVEAPASNYGEAFVREQKQEKLAREAATAQTAAHLGMALFSGSTQPGTSPGGDLPTPTANMGNQGNNSGKDLSYLTRQVVQRTTSPATWMIALVIVALLFLIGIIS